MMASFLMKSFNSGSAGNHVGSMNIIIPDQDDDGSKATPSNYYTVDGYSAAVLFEVFLYGVYSTLFTICIRVLMRNKRTTRKLLVACAMMMFALATVDVVLELSFLFWFVIKKNTIPDSNLHFKFLIYITSNIIADALVIYRCHSVWGTRRVVVLPIFLLVGGSACGYAFIAVSKEEYRFRSLLVAFLFTTVTLNMLVTVLMAGRIWWIARKARSILGPRLSSKYNTMIAIVVESGVIYSIYVILDVVFPNLVLDAGLAQVVGIVPTLIIVQIGLGRDAHEVDGGGATSIVRTDGRFAATTEAGYGGYDAPPSGPPPLTPIISSPSIPPMSFLNTRTSRLYETHRDLRMNEGPECGIPGP